MTPSRATVKIPSALFATSFVSNASPVKSTNRQELEKKKHINALVVQAWFRSRYHSLPCALRSPRGGHFPCGGHFFSRRQMTFADITPGPTATVHEASGAVTKRSTEENLGLCGLPPSRPILVLMASTSGSRWPELLAHDDVPAFERDEGKKTWGCGGRDGPYVLVGADIPSYEFSGRFQAPEQQNT